MYAQNKFWKIIISYTWLYNAYNKKSLWMMDRWMSARQKLLTSVYVSQKSLNNQFSLKPFLNLMDFFYCCLTVEMVEVCTEQRNSL